MEIATDDNQITIIYIEGSIRAKKTLAYCLSSGLPIREINISRTKLTGTMIIELATKLKIKTVDLVNTEHPIFLKYYGHELFSDEDVIKIIHKHPDIMKQPIVIRGDNVILIETPTDVLQLIN